MNEKLEKNENKKTADVLRAENLVRDYVQYGEDGEKKKEIHVLKGLNFSPETGVCRNYGKIRMWKNDTFETIGYDRPSDRRKAVL